MACYVYRVLTRWFSSVYCGAGIETVLTYGTEGLDLTTRANPGEELTIVSADLFRSPLSLFSSSKNALSSWKSRVKMPRIWWLHILAERDPYMGCSKLTQSPRASTSSKTPERLKHKLTGQQVMQQHSEPRLPSLFGRSSRQLCAVIPLWAPAYSAPAAPWPLEGQLCRLRPSGS
jgi:hypothetical protein